jgi:hypothetical protein
LIATWYDTGKRDVLFVIPAEAGIQESSEPLRKKRLDPGFRRGDVLFRSFGGLG